MINVRMPEEDTQLKPRITVIGVGGGGCNAVNNMIQSNLEGVEFLVCNTDAQSLQNSLADRKIQLGTNITRGLGAGARPDIGRAAAEEALDDVMGYLDGSNMAFITAGMGGGTGSGAAPVIARAAREAGILTVGVVTKPFHFEGQHRMRIAEGAIEELQQYVDTLLIIPNQNLFRVANEKTTFADAFKMADDVLNSGVRGVTDLMVMPGLINLDFADIRTVMAEMGKAMMGTGEAEGERRAIEAAEAAISNPLLEDTTMQGARGVLVNITGGYDMTLFEVDEACNRIRDEVDPNANIIFGSTFNEGMEGRMRVSVVATGIESESARKTKSEGGPALQTVSPMQTQQPVRPAMGGYHQQHAEPKRQTGTFGGLRMGMGMGGNNTPNNSGTPTASAVKTQSYAVASQPRITASTVAAEMTKASFTGNAAHKMEIHHEIIEEEHNNAIIEESSADQYGEVQYVEQTDVETYGAAADVEEGSFIPPSPVAVNKKDREASSMIVSAPSFSAESSMRVSSEQTSKKSMSLFERLTGSRADAKPEEPVAAAPKQQPSLAVRAPREAVHHHAAAEPQQHVQNSDDDLDIPAFLRRQVN